MKAPEPNFYHLGGALNDVPATCAQLCLHPTILEIAEHELGEGFILANNVDVTLTEPGAPPQAAACGRSAVLDASTVARISHRIAGVLDAHRLHAGQRIDGCRAVQSPHAAASDASQLSAGGSGARQQGIRIPDASRSLASARGKYQHGPTSRHGQHLLPAAVHPPTKRYLAIGEAERLRTTATAFAGNDEFVLMSIM